VTREESPFYFAIDLTGEKKDVSIKQGSLAPELKTLVGDLIQKYVRYVRINAAFGVQPHIRHNYFRMKSGKSVQESRFVQPTLTD
jgi:hypothetical protein